MTSPLVCLISVALFAIGSLCIAAEPDFDMLLVGRMLGLVGATHGMAVVLGPPLATLLTSTSDWRWLFLVLGISRLLDSAMRMLLCPRFQAARGALLVPLVVIEKRQA